MADFVFFTVFNKNQNKSVARKTEGHISIKRRQYKEQDNIKTHFNDIRVWDSCLVTS